jgi:S1-C subfamily serine protease
VRREPRPKAMAALAVAFFVAMSGVIGYTMGNHHSSSTANPSGLSVVPSIQGSQSQLPTAGQNNRGSNSSFDTTTIANQVLPSVVNINTTLDGGEAAGTGIILSSNGLVLTNNHVIADSTSVQVAIGGDDSNTHTAKVLGYDVADDVALIQIQGVSGLAAAPLGAASSLSVGDPIVAIGNAGGQGGTPSVVDGSVTALDQQITASDQGGGNAETLSNLVQVDANIQPGDSGGPLVNANGKVVGMDSAASSSNGGFGFGGQATSEGYAIPIENALSIAKKISSGDGGTNIHIGGNRALLGVQIQSDLGTGNGRSSGGNSSSGSGASVVGVQSGSGAEAAGLQQGDTIVGIDNTTINSATDLTHVIVTYAPKDTVRVSWVDSSGSSHHASVVLGSGPPA